MLLCNNKEIGGYFGIDFKSSNQFPYPNANKYNSARSALFELVKHLNIKKIWVPKFICDTVIYPLNILNIDIKFYNIDENFFPILTEDLKNNEYLYYVNYFGICTNNEYRLAEIYPKSQLIFDHAQAFYVSPVEQVTTLYSPRKFLPVADGGLLVTKLNIQNQNQNQNQNTSYLIDQYRHLFLRHLIGAESGYSQFRLNEIGFNDKLSKNISPITELILNSLDYKEMQKKRLLNFQYLHSILGKYNRINILNVESPLTYPFLYDQKFSSNLIEKKVYSPTYWNDCIKRVDENSFEYSLVNNVTHLICDHRYNIEEMNFQLEILKENML